VLPPFVGCSSGSVLPITHRTEACDTPCLRAAALNLVAPGVVPVIARPVTDLYAGTAPA
jgi:hypothetical protein